ncbi:MAG: LptA/OstA family protein [Desulfobacterales bacterium]|nr:LptA/OstA family protein [Desulfobacterales bacterium]
MIFHYKKWHCLHPTPINGTLFNTLLSGVSKFTRLFTAEKTQKIISYLLIFCFAVSLLFLFHPDSPFAAEKIQKQQKDSGEKKIHITADRLIAEGNSNNAEFIGNVRAIQETTVITSEKLKIFYKKDSSGIKDNSKGDESIKEIIATGNVKILFDDKIAETQQAVYTTETRVLVLNGPDSKVTSGKNTISGSKITFFRDDGRVKVEGSGNRRVEAFFESGGKGL